MTPGPQVWDAMRIRRALDHAGAADALAARLRHDPPAPDRPARTRVDVDAGQLLLMPDASASHAGVKLVSVARGNPALGLPAVQGVYVLLDGATLTPVAVLDAAELTLLRTAAVSLLGVRSRGAVERPRVTVVGAGPQGLAHAAALRALDPVVTTLVVRDAGRTAVARTALEAAGLAADVTTTAPLDRTDVLVTATTSRTPVLDDEEALPDHAVVVAVGSHEPDARELATPLLTRGWVVVEDRRTARREAGDLVLAERESVRDLVAADLGELVRGEVTPPTDRPRVLKTVGEAWQDLTVAQALLATA